MVSQDIVCLHQLSHFLPFETTSRPWCVNTGPIFIARGGETECHSPLSPQAMDSPLITDSAKN